MVAINLPSSYSYIFSLLKSPDWKIRNKIFRSFKKYHSTWAVDKISEFLNDESVWVRGSAIEALLSFGEEGEKILGSFDKDNKLKTDIEYYRMKA